MYTKQQVRAEEFVDSCDEFFALGGSGLNITLPLKELAYDYATELTPRAKLAGAVNTLKLQDDCTTILGDNTDGYGLVADISRNLKWKITNKRVLVLGAGGAVRGILAPLMEEGPSLVVLANRTVEKAQTLARLFENFGNIEACGFDDIPDLEFDLIINGTSMSLQGQAPPISNAQLNARTCCYDLAYGDELTPFLFWAKAQSVKYLADGLGMLVEQAAESFFVWRGVRPETKEIIAQLRELQNGD